VASKQTEHFPDSFENFVPEISEKSVRQGIVDETLDCFSLQLAMRSAKSVAPAGSREHTRVGIAKIYLGGPYEKTVLRLGSRISIAVDLTEPNRGSSINFSRNSCRNSLLS
jgi:hypothetical protein